MGRRGGDAVRRFLAGHPTGEPAGGTGASTGGSPGRPVEQIGHERGEEIPGVTEMLGLLWVAA